MIGVRSALRTIDEDFRNWIDNNKLPELYFLFDRYILIEKK